MTLAGFGKLQYIYVTKIAQVIEIYQICVMIKACCSEHIKIMMILIKHVVLQVFETTIIRK